MQEDTDSRRVPLERSRELPLARERLVRCLQDRLEGEEREQLGTLARELELRLHMEHFAQLQALKGDFELFGDSSARSKLRRMSQEEIEQAEDRFVRGFVDAMRQAGYRLIDENEASIARRESYLLELPLRVHWERLDAQPLSRFWGHNDYVSTGERPEFADRLLVFHRGVGVDQSVGLHFWPKVKQLIKRAIDQGYRRTRQQITRLRRKEVASSDQPKAQTPSAYAPPSDDPMAAGTAQSEPPPPISDPAPTDPASSAAPSEASGPPRLPEKFVERIRLEDQPLTIASLRQKTVLQEPTFRDLVTVYRLAAPAGREKHITERDRTFHIQEFHDVPMADLELAFPESQVDERAGNKAQAIGIGGLLVGAFLLKAGSWWMFLPALALIGVGVKFLLDVLANAYHYTHLRDQVLHRGRRNDDLGVLLPLLNDLEERQLKSTLLAYYFVWRESVSSPDELKHKCEALLEQEFAIDVEFDASGAIKALTERGLVTRDDERLSAIDPAEAARRLATRG